MDAPKTLAGQWIEIFRAGDYGDKGNWDAAKLDQVVNNYKPSFHEAPIVIGHPELNAPAYGWVEGLKRDGDVLLAKPKQVDPEFDEMVRSGKFKKRSASFYLRPEGPSLRHIGFLGAQPPDVKGLSDVKFDESIETAEVVFQEDSVAEDKNLFERLTAWFQENKITPGATASFDEGAAKKLIADAIATAVVPFQTKITELEGELKQHKTSFAEREKTLASGEVEKRVSGAVTKLHAAGKWLPAFEKMGLTAVFSELAKQTAMVEFGEGDQKKQIAPLDLLVSFMEKLPKVVPVGEVFKGVESNVIQFGESKVNPGRRGVDTNSGQLNELAKKRQVEAKVSFAEALDQVARENPNLTAQPGSAAAGQV